MPTVPLAEELLDRAFKKASRASLPKIKRRNKIVEERLKAIQKVKVVEDIITSRLLKIVKATPNIDEIHPFYREVLIILVGEASFRKALAALSWASMMVRKISREYQAKIRRASDKREIIGLRREAYGRIASIVKQIDPQLKLLLKAREKLRKLPTAHTDILTIVVAGFPNVGKSSLVKAISTANPEVAHYPFTTQDITVGFLKVNGRKIQVIDTPGILDRPMKKRKKIELKAIAAIKYLADKAIFLIDATELSGYSIEEQLKLLREVEDLIGKNRVFLALSKGDILDSNKVEKAGKILKFIPPIISIYDKEKIINLIRKLVYGKSEEGN